MELLIILILTIIVLPFSGMLIIEMSKGNEFNGKLLLILFILFLYPFLIFFLSLSYINKPKAIDVYRGKTTLEITYKNRVPIDSIVVWK